MPGFFIEELHGSPQLHLQRRASTATRRFIILWADRNVFFAECFPSALSGYPFTASYPGYPFLFVESVDMQPMFGDEQIPSDLVPTFPPNYAWAEMTVHYHSPQWDHQMQSHAPHATDGPGGECGSTKGTGSPHTPNATFLTHEVSIGAEAYKIPGNAVHWEYKLNTNDEAVGPGYDKARLAQDQTIGKTFAKAEHTLTWNFVPFPPWQDILNSLGKVNSYAIFGAASGTALFVGAHATREFTPADTGEPAWKLVYKFSVKSYNGVTAYDDNSPLYSDLGRTMQQSSAWGWNHFLRPGAEGGIKGSQRFQRLLTADGDPVYDDVDFTLLFQTDLAPPPGC